MFQPIIRGAIGGAKFGGLIILGCTLGVTLAVTMNKVESFCRNITDRFNKPA